ncbi:MAG: DJ-1/PfpI family protein [Candidatus Aenigmarchaeota archaeon]|nr:DJ-1/PfpI family protein [Candidatus Aenigmarchaeota archaeon]
MPKMIMPLPDGFEDIEAFTVIDVLRRAGIEVFVAGAPSKFVTSAHRVKVQVDGMLDEVDLNKYDGIVLPGGSPGYENLMKSPTIITSVQDFAKQGKIIAAICGAPMILVKAGVLKDKRATIAPGLEKNLDMPRGERVVVDGNIITSQGPGTAMEFALKIVELLQGKPKAAQMKQHLLA